MATNFPTNLDALVNPIATDSLATVNHADQHTNANDAIEALEAKVGVTGSAVTTSLDYRVRNIDAISAVVSASSSTNAVRITQTGTGNALVVEDETNPNATPFVINASGNVLVGTSTLRSVGGAFQNILPSQIFNELGSSGLTAYTSVINRNDINGLRFVLGKSRGTAPGGVAALVSGDSIAEFLFAGADGTTLNPLAARIMVHVDGAVATGSVPGRLIFATNPVGGTSPVERMRIDSAGNVGIGSPPVVSRTFTVGKSMTGSTAPIGVFNAGQIQSDVTGAPVYYNTFANTAAAAFTVSTLTYFNANQGTFGIGSTVTSQIGFAVSSNLTGATNNYGFSGNLNAATGTWNLHMGGNAANYLAGRLGVGAMLTSGAMMRVANTTASDKAFVVMGAASQSGDFIDVQNSGGTSQFKVDSSGQVGIGATPAAGRSFVVSKNITGSTISISVVSSGTIQSDVTSDAISFRSNINTVAAAFTLSSLSHFQVVPAATAGAGSTITSQFGFSVASTMTGATNNYGFYGDIGSGTGRYNLYMNGSADNYLAGNTGIGVTVPTSKLHVVGSFSRGAPVTKTASFTLADTENWVICNGTATITVTLPAASTQVGREITIKNIAAFTVVSASSNIVPIAGGTVGTAILAATAGTWAKLVSDGANWVIMQS